MVVAPAANGRQSRVASVDPFDELHERFGQDAFDLWDQHVRLQKSAVDDRGRSHGFARPFFVDIRARCITQKASRIIDDILVEGSVNRVDKIRIEWSLKLDYSCPFELGDGIGMGRRSGNSVMTAVSPEGKVSFQDRAQGSVRPEERP